MCTMIERGEQDLSNGNIVVGRIGAQTLVRDVLSGIFMLIEDQYGVGDEVEVMDVKGTIESVGLRITTVRAGDGTLWYLRNGEILKVGNNSQPKH